MSASPRVSIGMPVRNGQKFIRQALDSLLAQTFSDFEIVICDNDSTDDTESICREYVARDPRIHYHRNPQNIGPAPNYNRTFELSKGEFFRWHAYDDLCEPTHLARCVETLDRDPSVVLVYPSTVIVDENNQPTETYTFHPATDSADVCRRFAELVLVNHRQHRAVEIFGLIRSAALRSTPLQGSFARGDSVQLVQLALLGRFVELPDKLFMSRTHTSQSMQTLPSESKVKPSLVRRILGTGPLPPPEWWDGSRKGKINFPEWNLIRHYWRSLWRAPLTFSDRMGCLGVILKWFVLNPHKLARDVIFAIEILCKRIGKMFTRPQSPGCSQPGSAP